MFCPSLRQTYPRSLILALHLKPSTSPLTSIVPLNLSFSRHLSTTYGLHHRAVIKLRKTKEKVWHDLRDENDKTNNEKEIISANKRESEVNVCQQGAGGDGIMKRGSYILSQTKSFEKTILAELTMGTGDEGLSTQSISSSDEILRKPDLRGGDAEQGITSRLVIFWGRSYEA